MMRVVVFNVLGRAVVEVHRETAGPDKSAGSKLTIPLEESLDEGASDGQVLISLGECLIAAGERDVAWPF